MELKAIRFGWVSLVRDGGSWMRLARHKTNLVQHPEVHRMKYKCGVGKDSTVRQNKGNLYDFPLTNMFQSHLSTPLGR